MRSIIPLFVLFNSIIGAAVTSTSEAKAQLLFADDGRPLLKLDYATYKGTYNETNQVCLCDIDC